MTENRNETTVKYFATGEVHNPDGTLAVPADPIPSEFLSKETSND